MDYQKYIKSELLILIPVLYFIGMGLKKSKIPDKLIPIILGIVSICLSAIWIFATSEIDSFNDVVLSTFISITQGILLAGARVYTNQLYVQSKKE